MNEVFVINGRVIVLWQALLAIPIIFFSLWMLSSAMGDFIELSFKIFYSPPKRTDEEKIEIEATEKGLNSAGIQTTVTIIFYGYKRPEMVEDTKFTIKIWTILSAIARTALDGTVEEQVNFEVKGNTKANLRKIAESYGYKMDDVTSSILYDTTD